METTILKTTEVLEEAIAVNYTALLNCYCREFSNWSRYMGIPKYDQPVADHFKGSGYDQHIRIDFSSIDLEVYIPLKYFSESGRHLFCFPVVQRHLKTDEIKEVSPHDFVALTVSYGKAFYPGIDAAITQTRLQNSIDNLETYLNHFLENEGLVNEKEMSFIKAEQSLLLGHIVHPLPKSKLGFNEEDLLKYSPETGGRFKLHYFLIHPENIIEKTADDILPTAVLKADLLKEAGDATVVAGLLQQYPEFTVVPMHPWEALYLLQQEEVQQMQAESRLFSLGQWGEFFTATSSVRTVYHEDCDWMFKFSLHVKITNSERINLYPELHRGYDITRLLKTEWGQGLQKDFPEIDFIVDPAFIAVRFNDKVINGFNISIRRNPFKAEAQHKNVSLLAALCQDGILGEPSRLNNIISTIAEQQAKPISQVAERWFKQYLHICIRPIVGMLNKYGLACEFHQQNVMVELDKNLFPAKLYFRDNQGFFFREGRQAAVSAAIPGIAEESQSIMNEAYLAPKYTYYLVTNNILGVVNAFGCQGLAEERRLLDLVYKEFKDLEDSDETGLVSYILNSRSWDTKANYLTSLQNINEADVSMEYPAVFKDAPNPLSKYFLCHPLVKPSGKEVVYTRYFEEQDLRISLRPFDIDRDLELVHEWFNREHAIPFWKMNGPIRNLETFYRTILPSDEMHSFIGEINGVPAFTFEPYWPMRDVVGAYYDALPTDHGTHFFVAETQKDKKFSFQSFQTALDWIFSQPEVGRCIGEASSDAIACNKLIGKLGYSLQGIIEMPHKTAALTFCTRDSYFEKCPDSKLISPLF